MDTTTDPMRDAIIVGGGAAGLTAGVVLARAQFTTLVVDGGEPRNGPAEHMHGYLTRDGMAPKEFVATGQDEFARYGGTLMRASVSGARRGPDGTFELRLGDDRVPDGADAPSLGDDRVLRARSVLVATGLTDELPGIPGLAERWATEVHHCPHCHGYEVRGRAVAVIGGAAVSVHLAALMRRYSSLVTFCVNGAEVGADERRRLTAYGVRLVDGRVTRIATREGAPGVSGTGDGEGGGETVIELDDGRTVACEAVFVAPRPVPHDAILTALGAGKDPASGLVAVDPHGATDIPGLWAAGNVVNPRAQVVSAAGAGSVAAVNMAAWLLDRELSAAVQAGGLGAGSVI
ncbi:NAD(P)/FAD-dependent oxidoreductase [Nonomuraea roseoviolacea]|uniref:Thioredoxin reductase (NADPH) n=1 Tax=Nonomuraea roseoviolacea subsp. carminata TaxID=160689 RepID=A0ABT1JWC6_9ACTN|nr:NAD(P)/FAD-dependent oxidoreductase [Nonomuraea roseoviolacea]MCP2346065.1 thioredoxin reductase (NADPH) [Nonomuraea roseoviolacea subsp. carminata]